MTDTIAPQHVTLDPTDDRSSHELVAQLTAAAATPKPITNQHGDLLGHVIFDDGGQQYRPLTAAELAQRAPERIRAARTFAAQASFIDYLKLHAPDPETAGLDYQTANIYAGRGQGRFHAVIDDHHPADPSHCTHTATLELAPSPEWAAWAKHDNTLLDQVDFAEHIEDQLDTIVEPAAADMLEIAQHLEATRNVQHRSGQRLSSGRIQFILDEQLAATTRNAAGQTIDIPETFTIAARIYEGTDPYRITCRLRYRIDKDGKLRLGYKIHNRDRLIETALDTTAALITDETGITVWWGRP